MGLCWFLSIVPRGTQFFHAGEPGSPKGADTGGSTADAGTIGRKYKGAFQGVGDKGLQSCRRAQPLGGGPQGDES